MSSPVLHAFYVGRALADAVNERAERLLTDGLSLVGKFDAEQREYFRQFTEEVMARAQQVEAEAGEPSMGNTASASTGSVTDLQATIDNLRAEIAQVRVALQQYRATSQI
ncbi:MULTISPECIES: DUF6825 family protein [unclassified Nodosilinea]|uniref:Thylakoid lumen protein n=1 Tax=Leptolyngbya subtilissima DQ-A4 TaxID=2933933 RepID=A0ABV0JYN2_9CYAN|nr:MULTISPECIES: hypothetical protein [unclassified Nodosilinea]MBD2109728.1 hypothetical protein [Nodosilinea sp. FACHB-13]MBD2112275.1 hypothetical protein [Nodosilinea sp. FACHB-141]